VADQDEPRPPLAEEAVKVIGAVQEWARQNFPAGPDGHMGAECQWCPLCQFMSVVRGERPEVTARVAEAGTALATAFRALMDASAAKPDTAQQQPRVQRIDLGEPGE
jgi:hypothetical protein